MKTNPSARRFLRIRGIVVCLALVGLVATALGLGASLAAQVGPINAARTESLPAPNASLAEVVAVLR